ncbi:hypothetical protein PENTCL1PPCAC_12744, partial [Pristionchus entomophagus]
EELRLICLSNWRTKAFSLGRSDKTLGPVITKTLDLMMMVVRDGTTDEDQFLADSVQELSEMRDQAAKKDENQLESPRDLVYGISVAIGSIIQSLIDRGKTDEDPSPESTDDLRLQQLLEWREKAFVLGKQDKALGSVLTSMFDLARMVVRDGAVNEEKSLCWAMSSLKNTREFAQRHDTKQSDDPFRSLIYGITEAFGVMLGSLVEEPKEDLLIVETALRATQSIDATEPATPATLPELLHRVKQEEIDDNEPLFADEQPGPSRPMFTSHTHMSLANLLNSTGNSSMGGGATFEATVKQELEWPQYETEIQLMEDDSLQYYDDDEEMTDEEEEETGELSPDDADFRPGCKPRKRRRVPKGRGRPRKDASKTDLRLAVTNPAIPDESGMFACTKCDKVFPTYRGLKSHAYKHDAILCTGCSQHVRPENMPRHSTVCIKGSNVMTQMQKMQKKWMREPESPEMEAGLKLRTEVRTIHRKTPKRNRREEPKKPCPVCGHLCANKSHLDYHMRTHTGELPFACPHCNLRFRSLSTRNNHIGSSHGLMPYNCTICGRTFDRQVNLRLHHDTEHKDLQLLQPPEMHELQKISDETASALQKIYEVPAAREPSPLL